MSLAPLYPLTNQFQGDGGENLVGGFLKVYYNGTDDTAETFADAAGEALNPSPIILDNNGMASVWVDSARIYRLEVYYRSGRLCYTRYPVVPVGGGSSGSGTVGITSTDGSIGITRTSSGGKVTYDLSAASDDPGFTEWAKCSGANVPSPGIMIPLKADGNMDVTADGVTLKADNLYHITARFAATKTETGPYYDKVTVAFNTNDGEQAHTEVSSGRIVDYSMGLEQEFEISADIKVGARDVSLYFSYSGQDVAGGAIRFRTADIHMLNSGVPSVPGGMASREWVSENYQEKLTAGEGITIEDNVISADASQQVQSDWTEQDTSSPAYIQNKPDMSSYATDQELTAGLATKQDVIQDIAAIRAGAQRGATSVQPSDLAAVATSGSYNDLSDKPSIPAPVTVDQHYSASSTNAQSGTAVAEALDAFDALPASTPQDVGKVLRVDMNGDAEWAANVAPQVQSDWAQTNAAAVDYIKNKPSLAPVATSGSYNDLSDKPSIPAAQVNSDWNASSGVAQILNKPALATVATTGAYSDLSGTPSIPTTTSDLTNDSGFITAADIPAQQQSDWTEADTSDPSYIQNKPSLATVATTGDYSDLSNTPTIPVLPAMANIVAGANVTLTETANGLEISAAGGTFTQQQSDWAQSDNTQVDFIKNKPALAAVATSGDYSDLTNTPTIPAAQVNSDWNASSGVAQILNKPSLATVATSGSYTDLSNTPSIPTATSDLTNDSGFITASDIPAQVNSDWNASSGAAEILNKPANLVQDASYVHTDNNFTTAEKDKLAGVQAGAEVNVQPDWSQSDSSADDYIKNKPALATVATSGDYADLSNKPTIPAAQVNSDWNANSGVAQILNKPNLAAVATSGDYDDLSNKPAIPAAQVQSNWTESDSSSKAYIQNKPPLATVATSGSYTDLSNTPTIPVVPAMKDLVAGTNVTITEDNNGVTISADGGPVDQVYDATSPNAQSGVAVASAVGGKQNTLTAGDGIDITNDVISAETPIEKVSTLPASPDPSTMYVTPDESAQEVTLYSGIASTPADGSAMTYNLTESPTNFQYIKVYCCARSVSSTSGGNQGVWSVEWDTQIYDSTDTYIAGLMNGNAPGTTPSQYGVSATLSGIRSAAWSVRAYLNSAASNAAWFHIYKIVGRNRISS